MLITFRVSVNRINTMSYATVDLRRKQYPKSVHIKWLDRIDERSQIRSHFASDVLLKQIPNPFTFRGRLDPKSVHITARHVPNPFTSRPKSFHNTPSILLKCNRKWPPIIAYNDCYKQTRAPAHACGRIIRRTAQVLHTGGL